MKISMKAIFIAAALAMTMGHAAAQDQRQARDPLVQEVDLTKLDDLTRNKVIDSLKAAQEQAAPAVTVDNAKKWAETGKGIGEAIAASAKALNTGVNDFIKTPAGTLVVYTILIYLFGHTVLHVVLGLIIWVVLGILWWKSFQHFHWKRIVWNPDKTTSTVQEYDWNSKDAKTFSAVVHFFSALVLCGVMIGIVFN